MKKKIIAILMIAALALPFGVDFSDINSATVSAATVKDKIDQASKDKQAALDKIKDAETKKNDVIAQSDKLEREIDIIQTEIYAIDDIIADADAEIAVKEEEIARIASDIEIQDEKFKETLRAMDETSTISYIELIFSSKNLSELLINIETINEITEHDMSIIDEMTRLKTEVEEAKAEIEAKRNEQEEARSFATDKRNQLEVKLKEKENLAKSLEKDIEKYKQVYEEARRQEEALKSSLNYSSSSSQYLGSGRFCWPAPSYTRISSPYGYRIHPIYKTKKFHSGVDLAAPGGTNILAAENGRVISAGWNGGYGNCLVVDHGGGVSTLYAHASRLVVSKGTYVTKGQVIAKVGTTGNSTGNHLHFEVLINGKTTNPMSYIK